MGLKWIFVHEWERRALGYGQTVEDDGERIAIEDRIACDDGELASTVSGVGSKVCEDGGEERGFWF
jgi:hypothetical protein